MNNNPTRNDQIQQHHFDPRHQAQVVPFNGGVQNNLHNTTAVQPYSERDYNNQEDNPNDQTNKVTLSIGNYDKLMMFQFFLYF